MFDVEIVLCSMPRAVGMTLEDGGVGGREGLSNGGLHPKFVEYLSPHR
jgi:hypothetical protein